MGGAFWLSTKETSYILEITKFRHLEHIFYGPSLKAQKSLAALRHKNTAIIGSSIIYDESDDIYSLDSKCLEWSGIGRGDYRISPLEVKMPDGSYVQDFLYKSHVIHKGAIKMETLPNAYGSKDDCMTLRIDLEDKSNQVELQLYYTVYEKSDVITRRAVLLNHNVKALTLRRALSMMMDLPNRNYKMITLDGGWINEAHINKRLLTPGTHVNSSTTGGSSNRHNPGFIIASKNTTQEHGWAFGFNLVYSGNHYSAVELSNTDIVRVTLGINPHCFEWELGENEEFETPEAIMSFSDKGYNGVSHHMHDFINEHIVRGNWKKRERPILLNNWEAHFFDFNEHKLLKLAEQGKKLGMEMFVLDDGWFGKRDSDKAGLGDYSVNEKKLPNGIRVFGDKIRRLGLAFGLWFEPEMINEESDLYKRHPEYVITLPGKNPTFGRHQRVLDLCKPEVQNYIIKSVSKVLDEGKVTYVKWDMNRHMSEVFSETLKNQGEFFHRYILGLYRVLEEIFIARPHILLESCSSGGNRFDLGMLCFSPQIWSSDNTDPIERLEIQGGLSYLYPPSTMGAHVSMAPHQQTLRQTPLSTRFNVAVFGCLGYEMDLKQLTKIERKEISDQILWYKEHRRLLQYGEFSRVEMEKSNKVQWQSKKRDNSKAITGFFQTIAKTGEGYDYLRIIGLDEQALYKIETLPQRLYIERFGALMKHVLPINLNPDGIIIRTANKVYSLQECVETYEGQGGLLESGVLLNNQFIGTGYNKQIRMLGDFGSNLYIISRKN